MPPNREVFNESPHKGLNPKNWQEEITADEIRHQVVYFSREARNAPVVERINPIAVSLNEFSKLVKPESDLATDIATKRIYEWAKNDSPAIEIWTESVTPKLEEILEGMLSFCDLSPGSLMVWISPNGGVYAEARINIYSTVKVNNEPYIFFWGIPTQHTDEQCLNFYRKLHPYIFGEEKNLVYNNVEDLRINPCPLSLPPEETSLSAFFGNLLYLPEVWEAIGNGQILERTIKEMAKGEEIFGDEEFQEVIMAQTESERRRIGAKIELNTMRILEISLLANAHGGLYSNMLTSLLSQELLTSFGMNMTGENGTRYKHCGSCGQQGEFSSKTGQIVCKNAIRVS